MARLEDAHAGLLETQQGPRADPAHDDPVCSGPLQVRSIERPCSA
jgi:hypothetical protein